MLLDYNKTQIWDPSGQAGLYPRLAPLYTLSPLSSRPYSTVESHDCSWQRRLRRDAHQSNYPPQEINSMGNPKYEHANREMTFLDIKEIV